MIRLVLLCILVAAPAWAEDGIALPSGQTVTFYDVRVDQPGTYRFRFLAPALDPAGQGLTYDDVVDDFPVLCDTYALPALAAAGETATEIVISLMDRPVEFGVATPDAVQMFEPYTVQDGHCLWEQF